MNTLAIIGFLALVGVALVVTGSALVCALMGKAFAGEVDPFAYVMAVVAILLWVAVYFMAPFEFVLKGGA